MARQFRSADITAIASYCLQDCEVLLKFDSQYQAIDSLFAFADLFKAPLSLLLKSGPSVVIRQFML